MKIQLRITTAEYPASAVKNKISKTYKYRRRRKPPDFREGDRERDLGGPHERPYEG